MKKRTDGRWRVYIAISGVRKSKILPTKRAAKDWADSVEHEIKNADEIAAGVSFGELLDRYACDVSPNKGGAQWEIVRLAKIGRDEIASVGLQDLRASHFAKWRDRRLKEVAPASVNREMVLMSSVLTTARKEWGLIRVNPMTDVAKPPKPPARDRLASAAELESLALSAGSDLNHATARAFHAFLFSVETAMRAGEVAQLTWASVDLDRRVARLLKTKNGHPRDVPLSSEAVRLLKVLPALDTVFGLTADQISSLFRKLRVRANVEGLTYHDSRHMAITRLSRKLDVLALARMVGHRDLRQLQSYYNETEPPRVYRRVKHSKGEPYDEEETYPRLSGRAT